MKPGSLFSPSSWRKRNQKVSSSSPERTSANSFAGRNEKPLPEFPISSGIPNNSTISLAGDQVIGDKRFMNSLPNVRQPSHTQTRISSLASSIKSRSLRETSSCIDVPSAHASPPRRPPRPPSLNLTAPPVMLSQSCPEASSPQVSCQRPKLPRAQTSNLAHPNNRLLKEKRSMPELDGVWKGFLEDVDEDASSLNVRHAPKLSTGKPRNHLQSASRHHPDNESNVVLPDYHNRTIRQRPKLPGRYHSSESSPYLPSSTSIPDSELGASTEFSLSLFPVPPPLIIRKKVPKPLILRPTPTIAPLPLSPNPGSSDSTPVATPTTPTQPLRSPRKTESPVSILKKSSSPTSTPTSSTFSPLHLNHNNPSSPPGHLRSTRLVQSVSHPPPAFSRLSAAHRTTRSDSVSPSSPHRSRLPTSQSTISFSQSYLVSGRVPKQRTQPPSQVEWGIAV